jgi:hypothetical protein
LQTIESDEFLTFFQPSLRFGKACKRGATLLPRFMDSVFPLVLVRATTRAIRAKAHGNMVCRIDR